MSDEHQRARDLASQMNDMLEAILNSLPVEDQTAVMDAKHDIINRTAHLGDNATIAINLALYHMQWEAEYNDVIRSH